MTTMEARASTLNAVDPRAGLAGRVIAAIGTIVVILALALLPLLTPLFMHRVLDAASSAGWLGVTQAQAERYSDQSVSELIFGPGTFAFAGPDGLPFYTPDEQSHMRNVRTLLFAFLGVALASGVAAGVVLMRAGDRRPILRAISRAGALTAIGVAVIGVVGSLAFDPLFELFHRIFFPGGNWAFDPRTSRLVRLYPVAFWEIAAFALGAIALGLGAATWWSARRREHSPRRGHSPRRERAR